MWCFVQRFSIFFFAWYFWDFVFIHSLGDLSLFYAVYLHKNILRFCVPCVRRIFSPVCVSTYTFHRHTCNRNDTKLSGLASFLIVSSLGIFFVCLFFCVCFVCSSSHNIVLRCYTNHKRRHRECAHKER